MAVSTRQRFLAVARFSSERPARDNLPAASPIDSPPATPVPRRSRAIFEIESLRYGRAYASGPHSLRSPRACRRHRFALKCHVEVVV